MTIEQYISEEPVAKAVENTQTRTSILNQTEKKTLLSTYDNMNHLSSLCNTQSRIYSTKVGSRNTSLMEDDDNEIELTTSENVN